jgi:hypothetical protein
MRCNQNYNTEGKTVLWNSQIVQKNTETDEKRWGGDIAQWWNIYVAFTRPRVESTSLKRGEKSKSADGMHRKLL